MIKIIKLWGWNVFYVNFRNKINQNDKIMRVKRVLQETLETKLINILNIGMKNAFFPFQKPLEICSSPHAIVDLVHSQYVSYQWRGQILPFFFCLFWLNILPFLIHLLSQIQPFNPQRESLTKRQISNLWAHGTDQSKQTQ